MQDLVTTDTIMDWFNTQIEQKQPIDPSMWMEGAMKLNVLVQGEQERLYEVEQEVAKLRNILLESDMPYNKAKSKVEATEEYKNSRKQKAKVERIIAFISIAKQHSRMAADMLRNQL